MGWLVKFVLGKVSGPVLFYLILALLAANAVTGTLLKKAWNDNARASLECENQALRDANQRNLAVSTELQRIQKELTETKNANMLAAKEADEENAFRLHEKEIEHAEAIEALEVAVNEITDDEFWCAAEPVPLLVTNRMRDTATAYNNNRNSASSGVPPD